MIMGYAKIAELYLDCLRIFCEFHRTALVKPDEFTFAAVLKSCRTKPAIETGRQIQSQILKSGHCFATDVGTAVVSMYSKCGDVGDARTAFDEMAFKDEVSWGSMVAGYVRNGIPLEALRMCKEMSSLGFDLNEFCFSSCLAACSVLRAIDLGRMFHSLIIKAGFSEEVYVGSSMIDMYAKCGDIEDSSTAFHEVQIPNVVTFNALISGFAQHGRANEAILIFVEMKHSNITPNNVTFLAVLLACSHAGLLDESMYFFNLMRHKYGIKPELNHYCCMVDVFGRAGRLKEAYCVIAGAEIDLGISVWRTLLSACRKYGNIDIGEESAKVAMKLQPSDHASYALLSNLYSEAGRWEDASKMRKKMTRIPVRKNAGSSWVVVK